MVPLPLLLLSLTASVPLDSLDARLQDAQLHLEELEEQEAAVAEVLDAVRDHLDAAREYYNGLAVEEAMVLQQLSSVSESFSGTDSTRDALVESLSSYLTYVYAHRNLGGAGLFFVEGGFRRMMRRQAYMDYLASRAASEVFMLSLSRDSLSTCRDSLETLLLDIQELRDQMDDLQESIMEEEVRQAQMLSQLEDSIAAAAESLDALEARRQSRSEFVTQLSQTVAASQGADFVEPSDESWLEVNRGSVPWPADGQVVGTFGPQVNPVYGTEIASDGVTVATAPGADVLSCGAGTVLYAREFMDMGPMVILDHRDGYYTTYGHLAGLSVSTGDEVDAGQRLGSAGPLPDGRPGYYLEVRQGGTPVDPLSYLE